MKNLLVNIFKTLFFFDLALVVIHLIPDLKTNDPMKLLLWREGMPLAVILFLTLFYLLIVDRRKFHIYEKKGKIKSALFGLLIGAVVPSVILGVMWLLKAFKITGFNKVDKIHYYILAMLFNAMAGELLFRGYLFKIYQKHQGFIFATVFSTALFFSMNNHLLKLGKLYIANIILLNVFLCCMTDKAKGPFNIFARFVYTFISGFILGNGMLSEDYPILGKFAFSGKKIVSGGEYQIEGSVITTVLLSFLILFMLNRKYNLLSYLKKENLKRYMTNTKDFFGSVFAFFKRSFSIR